MTEPDFVAMQLFSSCCKRHTNHIPFKAEQNDSNITFMDLSLLSSFVWLKSVMHKNWPAVITLGNVHPKKKFDFKHDYFLTISSHYTPLG